MPERCQCPRAAIPDGRISPGPQPLIVAFAVELWVIDDGQSVLDADGVTQTPDSLRATPKVAELPVKVQVDSTPNDVIIDMSFVNVGSNDKCKCQ